MENNTLESIEVLTRLIEINNKRIVGYDNALKEIKESTIKCLFSRLADSSRLCKEELSTEVKKLGGVPREETPATSNLYKAWMDVKDAVAAKNRRAIFNCCEFGKMWRTEFMNTPYINIKVYNPNINILLKNNTSV